jgi:hypothetical protein
VQLGATYVISTMGAGLARACARKVATRKRSR